MIFLSVTLFLVIVLSGWYLPGKQSKIEKDEWNEPISYKELGNNFNPNKGQPIMKINVINEYRRTNIPFVYTNSIIQSDTLLMQLDNK